MVAQDGCRRLPMAEPTNCCPAHAPESILYLDGVSVSFDGFKALNCL